MPQIHPTAIVTPGAVMAEDVVIGPYCVVGENVRLGAGETVMGNPAVPFTQFMRQIATVERLTKKKGG